jgi:hypothetical protein
MLGLDLLRRGEAPGLGKFGNVRRIVHLADLLDLVWGDIDAELALQPILLQQHVVADLALRGAST